MATQDQIRDFLQQIENEDSDGDLVTSFVIIAKSVPAHDGNLVAYSHYWSGDIDERLGLLRYAQIKAEARIQEDEE